jgi:hypothetical protein
VLQALQGPSLITPAQRGWAIDPQVPGAGDCAWYLVALNLEEVGMKRCRSWKDLSTYDRLRLHVSVAHGDRICCTQPSGHIGTDHHNQATDLAWRPGGWPGTEFYLCHEIAEGQFPAVKGVAP